MNTILNIATPSEAATRRLVGHLHCHPATAKALVNRGITEPLEAKRFWEAPLNGLQPPFSMKGMREAVDRISRSLHQNETILIFGDYDVDGVTATTILYDFLMTAGGVVSYYIPHRVLEGYGLKSRHIREVALSRQTRLIITVDCGIGSHDAVQEANAHGIDVIITDHHEPPKTLPTAHSVVNPKRADCRSGLRNLAGVGVVFCLLVSLRRHLRRLNFKWPSGGEPNLKSYLDLVALGTIADMVPLTADNRILSKHGLHVLNTNPRAGMKALSDISGMSKNRRIDSEDIAFRLAPRLNAAGRMDHAVNAVRLLVATDPEQALHYSLDLGKFNTERQLVEQKMMYEIQAHIENHPRLLEQNGLIFAHEGWHVGVLGIVASRLVRTYHRPAILISLTNGIGKGSGRSVNGLDLHAVLCRCKESLVGFGGHSQAVGLEITSSKFEEFKERFHQSISDLTVAEGTGGQVFIDDILSFTDIDVRLAMELERLQPFGTGNPEPVFLAQNIKMINPVMIGSAHRRMQLMQENGRSKIVFNTMEFNFKNPPPPGGLLEWAAFRIRHNTWGGKDSVQLFLERF